MKKISIVIFSIALCVLTLPIRVFAENASYTLIDSCTKVARISYQSKGNVFYNVNNSVRAVTILYQNGDGYVVLVSTSSFLSHVDYHNNDDESCTVANWNPDTRVIDGTTYYYHYTILTNLGKYFLDTPDSGNNSYIAYHWYDRNIDPDWQDQAIYYTYGDGAVDPEPPAPDYGDLVNVGYNTKIAGSGDAAINNLDTISWNPEQDVNGNDISDMSVTIRAVPGKYSAQSSQSLFEQLYSNFVLDTLHVSELDTVNASDGSFSVTWNDVVHEFDLLGIPGFWFATKDTVKDPEGGYIKRGWIYQIRLEGEGYTGDWQTVYTATSSGVQNDLTIVNSSTINQTLINSITEINNLNNTENNWYINNTTINMGEYSDPGSSGKPWWAYLLEAIVSLLNGVIDAIANLVGSIIDGLLGLFSFDSFSIPNFTTNKQIIKQNSGIFGESIDLLQGINSTLSNADGTAEPILYYPGLELMGEEFIPEITINLNTYVSDLGLTEWHNLAYVCTDAMIWISLIYTIYRKLIGVFKK